MLKDVGMVICKSSVVSSLPLFFFWIPSLRVLSFLKCISVAVVFVCFFGGGGGGEREKEWTIVKMVAIIVL